jgi:hypothetical protein
MRRSWLALVLFGSLLPAACGPGQVAVVAEIDVPDPEVEGAMTTRPIADTEIQVLPFNRDAVFDSLTDAFGSPEPAIPPDLLAAQEEISEAQRVWRAAEAAWGAGRDRLQRITDEMEGLNRGEARYNQLYQEFQDVDLQVARAERTKDQAFEAFTDLQEGYIQRADSMRLVRDQWADDAFADAFDIFAMKLRESGREIVVDTTNAEGAALMDVPPGQWWVYARYELPFSELYWNIPVTVERGDPLQVRLTRETAEIRPKL